MLLAVPSEFEIIASLARRFAGADPDVLTGIGDDAAVVRAAGRLVISTDTVVEGVHVDLAVSSLGDAGYKAVTSAVSDIAAMGALARWALVAAVVPARLSADHDALAAGLDEGARACGVSLIGGDTTRGEHLAITVTAIGEAERPVLRAGARDGDLLCVTGALGASACGLGLLRSTDARAATLLERYPHLATRHRRPTARLREGAALAHAGAHAMIDLSDGLASDAVHLAVASSCGVTLAHADLPLDDGVRDAAGLLGRDPYDIAVAGGEDYELAVALDAGDVEAARRAVAPTPLTVIGRFSGPASGSGWTLDRPMPGGWDHFA